LSVSILNVTFDCSDAGSVARFWSEVTTWPYTKVETPGNPYWVVGPPAPGAVRFVFVNVPEVKTVKNRVHLDLAPAGESQSEEVARIVALGARIVDDRRHATDGGWVVMADPEGNEFDIEASPSAG
jgi:predicted enzyme related to lactoylglutathione lyase